MIYAIHKVRGREGEREGAVEGWRGRGRERERDGGGGGGREVEGARIPCLVGQGAGVGWPRIVRARDKDPSLGRLRGFGGAGLKTPMQRTRAGGGGRVEQ